MRETVIQQIGGEEVLRDLVKQFYDLVETLPEAARLRHLHFQGHGLDHARREQFDFLSGFLGGRRYYEERHGHMDLREIHAHVPITIEDARTWLSSMDRALALAGLEGAHIEKLRVAFERVALRLVNETPD